MEFVRDDPYLIIAEDDREMREVLSEVLSVVTLNILIAENGIRALHLISSYTVAAVLADVNMENLGGLQLLKELRQKGDQTPIVLISGNLDVSTKIAGLALQPCFFVKKPFSNIELQEVMARAFALGIDGIFQRKVGAFPSKRTL